MTQNGLQGTEETIKASHVFSGEDPYSVVSEVETFVKDKANYTLTFSTTPIMAGLQNGRANMVIITTCLVIWDSTPTEFRKWRERMKLMLKM